MRHLILALSAFALAAPVAAQTPPQTTAVQAAPAYEKRARELVGIFTGAVAFEAYFTPGFQTAVPKAKFDQINAQLTGSLGAPIAVERILPETPWSGIVHVRFARAVMAFSLTVDPAGPHQVSGLRVKGVVAEEKSLAEVTATLDKLPGATGYAFARLGAGAPELTLQHNADKPLAVGSAFKLVILAELVRATNAGERKWDDMVTLEARELPGGGYTFKPAGTKVSLRELATQMISISDNSATDILLHAIGRARVEAMLPVLRVADPARNRPFMATLDMFKLKGIEQGALATRYLALNEAGRRAMLDGELARASIVRVAPSLFKDRKPVMIDTLEWFFSPADLIRVMDWLRRNTEGPKGADARAVLSKNPGLTIDSKQFAWTGFKGGSEPGVINLTVLLQGADGAWYAAAASWNDTAAAVQDQRFAGLISALVKYAGPTKP